MLGELLMYQTSIACVDYGLIRKGVEYPILYSGYDYYTVRTKGKSINVPMWVFKNAA
jgi:hypothetical protein